MADRNPNLVQRASKIVTLHANREVKSYQILEGEVADLSRWNAQATLFWSLALSSLSASGGLWASMMIEGSPSDQAKQLMPILELAGLGLAVVFAVLGAMAGIARTSILDRIKIESGERGYPSVWNLWLFWRRRSTPTLAAAMPEATPEQV